MSPYFQPTHHTPSVLDPTPQGSPLRVVVVGAGPVGLATALGLARRGVPVTVLEAETAVSFGSRAICISRHSLEVASRLGVDTALADRALPWTGGRTFYGDQEVLHFLMPHDPHHTRPPMVNISQSEIEQVMADAAQAEPLIDLHWGTPVAGMTRTESGVALDVDTAAGPATVHADWVVAADGGRSRMRELAGLRLQGTAYEGRYVIADIHWESALPTERMVWFDPPSNPGSTVIMHRQPDDIWRIDYQLSPEDDADVETTEERIRERIAQHLAWLERSVGVDGSGPWTLEWHGFYKARALALDDFVHGRLLFAGDAAHLVPIFGVRGLNSGMEDAETLAWMLAAVVHDDASDQLLQAYSRERHHAWQQNISNAGKSTLIMTPGTEGYRTTRDALLGLSLVRPEFSHLIDPRQSSATHARTSVLTQRCAASDGLQPGDPLEDRAITTSEGGSSLHEVRGPGFGVYVIEPSAIDLVGATRVADQLRSVLPHEQVTTIALGGTVTPDAVTVLDDGGTAQSWSVPAGEIVVVRPDGLVLARGRTDELVGLGERLLGGGETSSIDGEVAVLDEREQVWLDLSDALDGTQDREGLLARLAFVLGAEVGPERLRAALAEVAPAGRTEALTPAPATR
ncbi:FAD-dependent oxidoreductase [Janibacter limosus]|uniref:FAD-dependent oxidoreductase n=1 Tax=Janibacter limosus TaxID=53458 RepID=A0A4P6MXD9_9MICO|nr:FAD-dependent oxidoreductase [Janibacter limosus]QBF46290.1 FAD-dependent oxidoreductase [Janibacter limosus]